MYESQQYQRPEEHRVEPDWSNYPEPPVYRISRRPPFSVLMLFIIGASALAASYLGWIFRPIYSWSVVLGGIVGLLGSARWLLHWIGYGIGSVSARLLWR
jgi:hypothetical protein